MSGTEVILHRSTDTGAPSLTGAAGSLIALLDACLVNGYNSKSVQSITRSGSTATVTFATAHGYAADGGTKVEIQSAAQTEYNGVKQIFNVTANTFDFTVTGTPATPATGTITSRVPPLGWGKPLSGTNLAAYRSAEVTGTRLFLRVADTGTVTANLTGYETMTDVNTGTGLFPTTAQLASGLFLDKANVVDSTPRPWVLVGDGFEFHLFHAYHLTTYANIYRQFHFGDPKSEMASDPYGTFIMGQIAAAPTGIPDSSTYSHLISSGQGVFNVGNFGQYFARQISQVGTSQAANKCGDQTIGGLASGTGAMAYPAPHNNGFYLSPTYLTDGISLRAQLKGVWRPGHTRPFGHGALIAAADSPINRRIYTIATANSGATPGETHVDIDGPWR